MKSVKRLIPDLLAADVPLLLYQGGWNQAAAPGNHWGERDEPLESGTAARERRAFTLGPAPLESGVHNFTSPTLSAPLLQACTMLRTGPHPPRPGFTPSNGTGGRSLAWHGATWCAAPALVALSRSVQASAAQAWAVQA